MKKTILLLLLSVIVIFQSCVDNSSTFPKDAYGVFYGELMVGDYTEDGIGISITVNSDQTVELFFDDVKFAKGMPLRIDMIVKAIPCTKGEDLLEFSATDIDPYMNKEPDPQPGYRFSRISGTIIAGELLLSAKMADDLKGSRAGKEFSFRGVSKLK